MSATTPLTPSNLIPFSAATRAAGVVVGAGYLGGFVDGPIVAVIGALGLITIGRGLLTTRADEALAGAALAVMAAGLGVGALRWGALGLDEMRSAQAVLGPTVLVGPQEVAAAAWLGVGAYVLALSSWLATLEVRGPGGYAVAVVESAVAALAAVTVFWGPIPLDPVDIAGWAGRVVVVVVVGLGLAQLERRSARASDLLRWVAVGVAAVAVAAATSLIGTTV